MAAALGPAAAPRSHHADDAQDQPDAAQNDADEREEPEQVIQHPLHLEDLDQDQRIDDRWDEGEHGAVVTDQRHRIVVGDDPADDVLVFLVVLLVVFFLFLFFAPPTSPALHGAVFLILVLASPALRGPVFLLFFGAAPADARRFFDGFYFFQLLDLFATRA